MKPRHEIAVQHEASQQGQCGTGSGNGVCDAYGEQGAHAAEGRSHLGLERPRRQHIDAAENSTRNRIPFTDIEALVAFPDRLVDTLGRRNLLPAGLDADRRVPGEPASYMLHWENYSCAWRHLFHVKTRN